MVLAVVQQDDFLYQLVYLLHIVTIVAAFAAAIVNPRLGALGQEGGEPSPSRLGRFMADGTVKIHFPALVLAGLFGVVLVLLSEDVYDFAQVWISIAFVLWFALMAVVWFLVLPAQRRIAESSSEADPKRLAMSTGIVHLLFLLMLVDMVWKPGVG